MVYLSRNNSSADIRVIGDSIAYGIGSADPSNSVHATEGHSPEAILTEIHKLQAADPNYFQGKKVVLSSGASNGFSQEPIREQVRLLKSLGASDVVLVGVSNEHEDFRQQNINGRLLTIAQKTGAKFVALTGTSSDKVHPASYGELLKRTTQALGGAMLPAPAATVSAPAPARPVRQTRNGQPLRHTADDGSEYDPDDEERRRPSGGNSFMDMLKGFIALLAGLFSFGGGSRSSSQAAQETGFAPAPAAASTNTPGNSETVNVAELAARNAPANAGVVAAANVSAQSKPLTTPPKAPAGVAVTH